jgi:hypothetical protein
VRRLAAVVVACLLTPLFAMPVGADSTTITTDITVGATHTVPSGVWADSGGCETGAQTVSGITSEFRCAFEFDITTLTSTNARVLTATLNIRRSGGCATNDCPVNIFSYAGNGSADPADVTLGSNIATWTPTNTSVHSWNVLGLIQAHVDNAERWAGFRLSMGSGNGAVQDFDISSGSRVSLAVTFVPLPVDVTVVKDGDGTGTITSSPAGIDCGSTCTAPFTYSDVVTLTAEPLNGSQFVTWSGLDCDGGNQSLTCRFTVQSVQPTITATFSGIGPPITQPPNATPHPSATTGTPKSPSPSSRASTAPATHAAPGGPTAAPQTVGPSGAPAATDGPVVTFAPGETVGPTIAPGETASDSGGVPLGPIILMVGIVLAIAVGAGAYLYVRRRQEMLPPGG